MPWDLFLLTFPIAVINGFGAFSQGSFWPGAIGQVITGVMSLICFGLIGYAFWQFGWKAGLLEILVVFGGANIGLSIWKRLRARLVEDAFLVAGFAPARGRQRSGATSGNMTLNTSSRTDEFVLTCPRCRSLQTSSHGAGSPEAGDAYVECSSCGFAYRLSAFQKQTDRERQRRAWPDNPQKQILLSDKPSARTAKRGVTMSFSEWVLWKLRHRSAVDRLTLRSGIHQVLFHALRLAQEYPEIPRAFSSPEEIDRFWTDPHHKSILDRIWQWMEDIDYIAADLQKTGRLTATDIRGIIDTELPRCQWGGGPLATTTYMTFALEFRGLLLATILINAQHGELPHLFSKILDWLGEEGWDHHGYRQKSAT